MIKSMMVARSTNGVIGKDNGLVWHLPGDLKYFKKTTMGHFVVMGRKTLDSTQFPLPGRSSIVITRNKDFFAEGCITVHTLEEAYAFGEKYHQQELFILGGGQIYAQAMESADKIYLTEVHATVEGDTYFPEINFNIWRETWREDHARDEKNRYDYSFVILERK